MAGLNHLRGCQHSAVSGQWSVVSRQRSALWHRLLACDASTL
ncbi:MULTISPECIES: hypothetical protein [unclassified Moorena]|nr:MULTISPECIES: hypothetical protein [unclassified Moorena]